jgi:hypothetical protein
MAPVVELPVDGLANRGFAMILYDVLDSLGIPTEKIKYVCRGEPGPDGFKGHIVVHLTVPASEFVPVLRAFETLEVEKHRGIRKLALEACCNTMDKLAVEAAITTTYNMHHLVHYIKSTEYLQDKVNRISQAWIDANRKCV